MDEAGTFTGAKDKSMFPDSAHEGSIYRLCLEEINKEMERVVRLLGLK
jgi:hypothetical protein